jgi:hypothetical protein
MDGSFREDQGQVLPGLVEGVKQNPVFVPGE